MTPEEIVLAAARAELKAEVTSGDVREFIAYLSAAGWEVVPREEAYAKCDVCGAAVDPNADACANCG